MSFLPDAPGTGPVIYVHQITGVSAVRFLANWRAPSVSRELFYVFFARELTDVSFFAHPQGALDFAVSQWPEHKIRYTGGSYMPLEKENSEVWPDWRFPRELPPAARPACATMPGARVLDFRHYKKTGQVREL